MVIAFWKGIAIADRLNTFWEIDKKVNQDWKQFYRKWHFFSWCISGKFFGMISISKVSQIINFIKKSTNWHVLDGIPTFYQHFKPFYTNQTAHYWSISKFQWNHKTFFPFQSITKIWSIDLINKSKMLLHMVYSIQIKCFS